MMSMTEEENTLFERWKEEHSLFVPDGAVDETAFHAASPSILFLMKEVNSKEGGWDLREFLRGGGRSATWNSARSSFVLSPP